MWTIVSSWFCRHELGTKRAPIPYSSIFPLAATLQQLCFVRCDQFKICVQGSVGQIWLLKLQCVEMSEKLQTTFWTLLMYSPWTSGNQKCMAIGNIFRNYYYFKGNLLKRQKGVVKKPKNATFDTECIEPNSALVQIHHVTEKVVCMIFSINIQNDTVLQYLQLSDPDCHIYKSSPEQKLFSRASDSIQLYLFWVQTQIISKTWDIWNIRSWVSHGILTPTGKAPSRM